MAILTVRDIHKRFDGGPSVLRGVNLDVQEGEIASLLGPSGCGKTTLLRIIAGLETPDRGDITFAGQDMLPVPVHQRDFGLMFQDYALFPHKDVAANVAFGLRMLRQSPAEIERRVQEMLSLVHLEDLAHRDVAQLSGGEQQRVALARSLAPRPRLLMLDEPLGALDRTLRDRLLEELRRILKQVSVPVIYVTHDQGEAFAVADKVTLMDEGRVVQTGTPQDVYRRPVNSWVARFLGMHNLLPGEWESPGLVRTDIGALAVQGRGQGQVTVLVRPEAAVLGSSETGTGLECTVLRSSFRGARAHVTVECRSGRTLAFDMPVGEVLLQAGESIVLTLLPDAITCLEH